MTKWDYLRQFHANHPDLGAREKEWCEAFDLRLDQALNRRKWKFAYWEVPLACQVAAKQAEMDLIKPQKKRR